eukprot:gene28830-32019_t
MLFCSQLLGPEFEKPNKIALLLNLLQLPPSHPNADTLARSGPGTEKMKIQEGSAWATTEGKRKGKRYDHERSTLQWKLLNAAVKLFDHRSLKGFESWLLNAAVKLFDHRSLEGFESW